MASVTRLFKKGTSFHLINLGLYAKEGPIDLRKRFRGFYAKELKILIFRLKSYVFLKFQFPKTLIFKNIFKRTNWTCNFEILSNKLNLNANIYMIILNELNNNINKNSQPKILELFTLYFIYFTVCWIPLGILNPRNTIF